MDDWTSPATRAVASTFRDVAVLRRARDLDNTAGHRRYGTNVLPPGFYLVNVNLLHGTGQKVTQLHNTPWDAIIVDEAHLIARGLLGAHDGVLMASPRAAIVLLTATPFQLSPTELQSLLEATLHRPPRAYFSPGEGGLSFYQNSPNCHVTSTLG
jgi:hypothetical protein